MTISLPQQRLCAQCLEPVLLDEPCENCGSPFWTTDSAPELREAFTTMRDEQAPPVALPGLRRIMYEDGSWRFFTVGLLLLSTAIMALAFYLLISLVTSI